MKCQEKCLQMPLLFRMFVFICGFVYIIFSWSVQLRNVSLSSAHEHEQQFRRFFFVKEYEGREDSLACCSDRSTQLRQYYPRSLCLLTVPLLIHR